MKPLQFHKLFIALFSLILLAGCASGERESAYADGDGPLTPLPEDYVPMEPEDHVLDQAIQDYLRYTKGPLFSRYDFTRVDLDGDRRRDALVMMKGPHSFWCDMNGCSLLIFKAHDDYFTVASTIFPVRGPMYVSDLTHQGWRNLIVRVSGLSYADAKNVALQYDGTHYPINPVLEPAIQLSQADQGQRLFP